MGNLRANTIEHGNLRANTIEHVSEMELYTILSTLEKFQCWNQSFNNEIQYVTLGML